MKKRNIVLGIAVLLALTMVLCACEEEEKVEYSWLTVRNLPKDNFDADYSWSGVIWVDEEITTQLQLHNYTIGDRSSRNFVVSTNNSDYSKYIGKSPFPLFVGYHERFKGNGTFLVELYRDNSIGRYILSDVMFKDGNATIDFKDMKDVSRLPDR